MYNADSLPQYIEIGYVGEKLFREAQFDMSGWDIPDGVPAVVYERPLEKVAYRPSVTYEDGILTWVVDDTDLGSAGVGRIQLEMKSTTKARKSKIFDVRVNPGIVR